MNEINDESNNKIINNNLDDNWIKDFENSDKLYKDFYKDNVNYINIHFIYVNKSNDIEKISYEQFLLSKPNILFHTELIKILKMYSILQNTRYSLLSILKYNINISPDEIPNFIKYGTYKWNTNYMTLIKKIDDIIFDRTINIFQDLNDLIVLFYEKNIEKNINNYTKKIHLHKHKKTIKKTT